MTTATATATATAEVLMRSTTLAEAPMSRNLTINEQAIIAIMDATGCTISRAKSAAFEHNYVPDAIAKIEAEMNRERERDDARRRVSPEHMADLLDSLVDQVNNLCTSIQGLHRRIHHLEQGTEP